MHDNWDKEKRLKDIYHWAISLPDRNNDLKKRNLELLKTHGNMIILENSDRLVKLHGNVN